MATSKATFGQTIRARRLGFQRSPLGWLRISTDGPGPIAVEVVPYGQQVRVGRIALYVVWWEDAEDAKAILSAIMRHFAEPPTEPVTLLLDDDGELVEGGKP